MDITVKIDRVTITGFIIGSKTSLTIIKNAISSTHWIMSSEYEFNLVRVNENGVSENVAGLFFNMYQGSWRLDTSNHLINNELNDIQLIVNLMARPHLTRLDVAFDIINGFKGNMKHRIYRSNASQSVFGSDVNEITGRSSSIQTIYSGKRKSDLMIRYYDKLAEQRSRHKFIPDNINQWERLEIQLRSKRSNEWYDAAREMLGYFKMPNISSVKNAKDRAMLFALENHIVEYNELASSTASKYRKLVNNNIGFDNEYASLMLNVLNDNMDNLNQEIINFLKVLDVDNDEK